MITTDNVYNILAGDLLECVPMSQLVYFLEGNALLIVILILIISIISMCISCVATKS